MKNLINLSLKLLPSLALILSFSLSAIASPQPNSEAQVYSFKFRLKGENFEFSHKSTSYEKAYEVAAKACYRHYKAGQRLTEDQGLDIIDVCANPRS
jgi:hypothetical protein